MYDLDSSAATSAGRKPAYDKLNYLGYSYGTWLGAWYADTYPSHTAGSCSTPT